MEHWVARVQTAPLGTPGCQSSIRTGRFGACCHSLICPISSLPHYRTPTSCKEVFSGKIMILLGSQAVRIYLTLLHGWVCWFLRIWFKLWELPRSHKTTFWLHAYLCTESWWDLENTLGNSQYCSHSWTFLSIMLFFFNMRVSFGSDLGIWVMTCTGS